MFASLLARVRASYGHARKKTARVISNYAKLIAYNFSSLLHAYAEERTHYKSRKGLAYKVSFEDVKSA